MIFDGPTSQKYSKYWCFHEISLFRLFRYFDDFRYLLGPHFGHFWRSWETIFLILWYIGYVLKFHWFSGSQRRHPKLSEPGCWVVNWWSRGSLQPTSPGLADLRPQIWWNLLTGDLWPVNSTLFLPAWWPLASRGRRIYIYIYIYYKNVHI